MTRPACRYLDEDYLILSTIHSAKGQEWNAVYVLNVVDGCIPSDLATGIERRNRGGAPPALRGDDARQGRTCICGSPALLRHAAGGAAATATSTPRAPVSSRTPSAQFDTVVWPTATADGTFSRSAGPAQGAGARPCSFGVAVTALALSCVSLQSCVRNSNLTGC